MTDSNPGQSSESDDFEFDPLSYADATDGDTAAHEYDEDSKEENDNVQQIRLRPAVVWECPECTKKNISYMVPLEVEDLMELADEMDTETAERIQSMLSKDGDEAPARAPDILRCRACKATFDSTDSMPEDEDFEDEDFEDVDDDDDADIDEN